MKSITIVCAERNNSMLREKIDANAKVKVRTLPITENEMENDDTTTATTF